MNASPTKSIDVRGLYCPEPVFRTKMEVERLKIGDILKYADDPESEEDISKVGQSQRTSADIVKQER